MNPEKKAELLARFKEFRKQPTLSAGQTPADEEMVSVARMVRKKRGSWWQLPKDYVEQPEAE
jgi:hypothetical protein